MTTDTPPADAPEPKTDQTRRIHGYPVERADGARLAFKNPKSGSNTIHAAKAEEPSDEPASPPGFTGRVSKGYRWSACGFGSGRKDTSNVLYIAPDEFDDEYIVRDGEVVGKLCGNCSQQL